MVMKNSGRGGFLANCLCLALALGFSSCGTHYVAVTPSAPLLRSSGDLSVSANLSSSIGWAGSASFAVLDQLSLMLEGSSTFGGSDLGKSDMYQSYRSFGAGLGTQFRYNQDLQGDLYIGIAKGRSHFDGHLGFTAADSGKANFTSYFAQSAAGLGLDKDDPSDVFGFQLRFSYLTFDDYFSLIQFRNGEPNSRETFEKHSDVLMSEHSIFIRVGPPSIKFTGFITLPLTLSGKTADLFTMGSMGIGLEFRHNMFDWTTKI
jgi:hypothetical protein